MINFIFIFFIIFPTLGFVPGNVRLSHWRTQGIYVSHTSMQAGYPFSQIRNKQVIKIKKGK